MEDQPVMRLVPKMLRDGLHQLLLSFFHAGGLGQTQAVGDAEDMGIHCHRGHSKSVGQHHVGGFAAHALQAGQPFQGVWHLAVKALHDVPRGLHNVGGF